MTTRRAIIVGLGVAAGWPLAARAQQPGRAPASPIGLAIPDRIRALADEVIE